MSGTKIVVESNEDDLVFFINQLRAIAKLVKVGGTIECTIRITGSNIDYEMDRALINHSSISVLEDLIKDLEEVTEIEFKYLIHISIPTSCIEYDTQE